MDVAARAGRVRAALGEVPALLVTRLVDVRWLTGFSGSAGIVLVLPDRLLLVTDGRYGDQAAAELAAAGVDAEVVVRRNVADQRAALAEAARGVGRLALQADAVTWADAVAYGGEVFAGVELVATQGVLTGLRATKDAGEIARLEAAAAIADAALTEVAARFPEGPEERDVAAEFDALVRRLGAEGASFDTIVASGPNAALPHHRPGRRRLAEGDLVIVDCGALVEGYHSDMTRTFALGDVGPEPSRMLDAVTRAQAAGVAAVRAGLAAPALDAACRQALAEDGLADAFTHGTGHGIGLEIHEWPRVGPTSPDVLAEGHVVTVEPGVYVAGLGGVRVEDSVLVTSDGCRPLTLAPKDPAPWLRSPRTT